MVCKKCSTTLIRIGHGSGLGGRWPKGTEWRALGHAASPRKEEAERQQKAEEEEADARSSSEEEDTAEYGG